MSDVHKQQAEHRLLEVLLTEELGDTPATNGEAGGRLLRLPPPQPRRSSKLPAAAMLLGVGIVALFLTGGFDDDAHRSRRFDQDPQGPTVVVPENVDEYLTLLATATHLQLVRKETVGAGRIPDGADRLDTIRWPQVLRIEGKRFETWRQALRRCSGDTEKSNSVDAVYDLEMCLPEGKVVRSFTSIAGEQTRVWLAPGHPMKPDADLRKLLDAAHREHLELRRKAIGRVDDETELLAMPRDAGQLDAPVELATAHDIGHRLPALRQLTLRGEPTPATWRTVRALAGLERIELVGAEFDDDTAAAVARMSNLKAVILRQCGAPTGDAIRKLGALRKLETLHLIDTSPGGEDLDLLPLASLPVLREFGLRSPHMLTGEHLDTIGHTKIERLLLVDLDLQGDLGNLRHLPSLEDLVLVAKLDDQQLQPLSQIESLQLLTVRNAIAVGDFLDAITSEVPGCRIDWTEDARWWQTDYAFRYIERAWPVKR